VIAGPVSRCGGGRGGGVRRPGGWWGIVVGRISIIRARTEGRLLLPVYVARTEAIAWPAGAIEAIITSAESVGDVMMADCIGVAAAAKPLAGYPAVALGSSRAFFNAYEVPAQRSSTTCSNQCLDPSSSLKASVCRRETAEQANLICQRAAYQPGVQRQRTRRRTG
jgi:hypothetical protein